MDDKNNVPNTSESFGNVPNTSESSRKENHTLTVRETQKVFEQKGVDITERSIINYCKRNKDNVSLLDCFFDTNERRYYITPVSISKAVDEVKARKAKLNQLSRDVPKDTPKGSETFGNVPNEQTGEGSEKTKKLEQELLDLKITNRGKDYFIEQMKGEREAFLKRIEDNSRLIGTLETKLLQLESPKEAQEAEYQTED